jgi:branched-chain amino acid transport system substrate-binding protein
MKSLKLIGLALGASLALSTAALAQDITIAVAGPITGSESAFGRQMKNGAEQAVADLNAAGGVLGKKLALEIGDDACDPKQARSVAEKIAGSKIPFVTGHYCSSSSIPACAGTILCAWICPKFADDFVVKSAHERRVCRTRRPAGHCP